jgi:hydroxyacylglutathione hydrolase
MKLIALPAFTDNYIWMLHDGRHAMVVDPGDAQPVCDALAKQSLQLESILVTHHHADHVGGVAALREATGAQVFGPSRERIPDPVQRLHGGDRCVVLGLGFEVLDVPGHTAGHIAYYCAAFPGAPLLFCGDTLFSGGCGRLFEGSPEQMLNSLHTLAALPDNTQVCCTHEYTLGNLRFALAVEPENMHLQAYQVQCQALREHQQPTLPSSLAQELQVNPFLRTREPAVMAAARTYDPQASNQVQVFAALRRWKNEFR